MANDFVLGNPIGSASGNYTLGPAVQDENAPAPETVIPKGGLPRQLNVREQREWGVYAKMLEMQDAIAKERADTVVPRPTDPALVRPFLTGGIPALKAGAREIGDAVLGAPALAANLMNRVPRAIINQVAPSLAPTLTPEFRQPTFNDALALIKSATSPMTFNEARDALDIGQAAMEKVHPESTQVGKLLGDVATITGPRALMAKNVVAGTMSPDEVLALNRATGAGTGMAEQFKATWNQPWFKSIRRGLTKAGETGIEGALLNALHGGDPLLGGIIGGTMQAAGSSALMPLMRFPKTASAGMALVGSIVALQMWKDVIPGGKDSIIGSVQDAIKSLTYGTAIGMGAALGGAGRYRGSGQPFGPGAAIGAVRPAWFHHEFARRVPALAESINAAIRTVPNSIIKALIGDDGSKSPVVAPILENLSTNSQNFLPAELDRIGKGIQAGKMRETVQTMLKDKTLVDQSGRTFAERMGMQ